MEPVGTLHTVVPAVARAAGLELVDWDSAKENSPTEVVVVVMVVAVELAEQSKVALGGEEGQEMRSCGRVCEENRERQRPADPTCENSTVI